MTAKERFFATLNFEETDRTPAYVLDGNSWALNLEGMNYDQLFQLPDVGAAAFVRHYNEINSDVITVGASCWLAWTDAFGGHVNASRVGRTIDVERAITDLDTQIPMLHDMSDEEITRKLTDNFYVQTMIRQIRAAKEIVGEEKALMTGLGGPFTCAATMCETGEFLKQIAKRNKKLPLLLEFTTRCLVVLAKLYKEAGIDVILAAEPTASGDMIAPRTFKQYVVPYYSSFTSQVSDIVPIILHICGDSGNRIEYAKEMGVKAFSVDSMVNMEEMLEKAEKKICMMGSLAPSDQMVLGNPESVYAEATRLLSLGKKNGGGFLLSTGCDYPSGASADNARAMVQAAIDFAEKA